MSRDLLLPRRLLRTVPEAVSYRFSASALADLTQADLMTVSEAKTFLSAVGRVDAELGWRHDYISEQQFGEGLQYWKGRRPKDADQDAFEDMLVMDDQIGPCMDREVGALFGKDPEWDAVQGENKLESSVSPLPELSEWHDSAGLNDAARDAARFRWWSGRMVGRVYIPDEYRDQLDGPGAPRTLDEVLDLIHVQAVDPREGGPVIDRHRRLLGYWFRYEDVDEAGATVTGLELHTARHVLVCRMQRGGEVDLVSWFDSPFSGADLPQRLRRAEYLMFHMDRDGGSAISRSVRDAQDRLNVVSTYMGRNDDQTGYRQLIVTNTEQPKDRKGNALPFAMGPGVALNLRGLQKSDLAGTKDRHQPDVHVVEPLDPRAYHVPSISKWKGNILDRLDQLWTQQGEVTVSGESKRQSRKPFDRRVAFGGQDIGSFLRWALRAALRLAEQVLDQQEYAEVRFQPRLFLDVDALNLDELRVKLQMWQAGALTLVALLEATPGISDAAKEAKAVEEGQGVSADAEAQRKALERLAGGGSPAPSA